MNITTLRIGCSNCNLREVCMPLGLTLKDMETVEELVSARRRIRRGEALYRAGDYFNNLYVVRLGFLKSTVMSSDGREQVTNFFMAGEMIGLDGISSNVYSCDVVALEDTEVCVLPSTASNRRRPRSRRWASTSRSCFLAKSCASTA